MINFVFWILIIISFAGFIWSLFQPDPFVELVEELTKTQIVVRGRQP